MRECEEMQTKTQIRVNTATTGSVDYIHVRVLDTKNSLPKNKDQRVCVCLFLTDHSLVVYNYCCRQYLQVPI